MKVGNKNEHRKTTVKLSGRLTLKFGIVVAAAVGCLLVAPLTRDHKQENQEQTGAAEALTCAVHP